MNLKKMIFFDLDGVLIETRELHFLALQKALRDFDVHLDSNYHEQVLNGLPTDKKLLLIGEKFSLKQDDFKKINEIKQRYTYELLEAKLKYDPVLFNLLNNLKQIMRIAVCSNSKQETLALILRQLKIDQFFEFTLSQEQVKDPKPSPKIYLRALELSGLQSQECLIVEDSEPGIASARASEIDYVVVKNPEETKNLIHSWISK